MNPNSAKNFWSRISTSLLSRGFMLPLFFVHVLFFTAFESKANSTEIELSQFQLELNDHSSITRSNAHIDVFLSEVYDYFGEKNDDDEEEKHVIRFHESNSISCQGNFVICSTTYYCSQQKIKLYVLFHSWKSFIS